MDPLPGLPPSGEGDYHFPPGGNRKGSVFRTEFRGEKIGCYSLLSITILLLTLDLKVSEL